MSNLFCRSCRKPLVTMRTKMQKVLCLTASNTHSSKSFLKTFEQKKSTRRVLLFASAFSVPLLHPPPVRNLLVKSHWYSGATVTTRWPPHPASAFSRDRGRGPRRFEGTFTFYSFLAEKVKFSKTVGQISLKFCQPPWNFLI